MPIAFDNNSSKGKIEENVDNVLEKLECLFLDIVEKALLTRTKFPTEDQQRTGKKIK